ncbi:hypothetical protein [Arsenicicoccus dermatophilus]|uniref:hypothetical protein n=1 Tax=Arsenicicoccus dermatophilus TaxID=1076331 RepID=UPI001F4C8444|nr:hypothetical protein [Arsenicicoccus dermatophilus]MCH8613815.1 hypothetical protein [Arsenicicoccus dermatophilus]
MVFVVVAAGVLLAIRLLARVTMSGVLSSSVRRRGRPRWQQHLGCWATRAALVTSLVAVGFLAVICVTAGSRPVSPTGSPLYSTTLLAVGLLAASAPVTVTWLARRVCEAAHRSRLLLLRHGARAASYHWPTVSRLVTVMVVTVLTCAMCGTFLVWVRVVTEQGRPTVAVQVPLESVAADGRAVLRSVVRGDAAVTYAVDGPRDSFFRVELAGGPRAGRPCGGGPCRGPLPAGIRSLSIPLTGHRVHSLTLLSIPVDLELPEGEVRLPLEENGWAWQLAQGTVIQEIPTGSAEYDRRTQAIHQALPEAELRAWGGQSAYALAREQAMILNLGVMAAAVLCFLSFVLVLDRIQESARASTNSLVALGTSTSFLRGRRTAMALLPIGVGGVGGVLVATLSSWAVLSMYGPDQIAARSLWWALGPAAGAVALVCGWAWLRGGHRFERQLLGSD